jgi:hypothetical protein
VLRSTGLRGDDHHPVTVAEVDERGGAQLARTTTAVLHQADRHRVLPACADAPGAADATAGELVDGHVDLGHHLDHATGELAVETFGLLVHSYIPRFQTSSSKSLRERQPSGVRTRSWW